LGGTHFGATAIRNSQGLALVDHLEPSSLDHLSLIRSSALPEPFLQACGVQDHVIRLAECYLRDRTYPSCFISYSRKDEAVVEFIRQALTMTGVPNWFAPRDMRDAELQETWQEMERDLYDLIDCADCFLLVVSPNILPSYWVAREVSRAHGHVPMLAILTADMPDHNGPEWRSSIAVAAATAKDRSVVIGEHYSEVIHAICRSRILDFRDWYDRSVINQRLMDLAAFLRETPKV
jgi:hypothetical protein